MNATGSLRERVISETKGGLIWPQSRTEKGRRGEAGSYFKARPFVRILDILSFGSPPPPKEGLRFETNLYTSNQWKIIFYILFYKRETYVSSLLTLANTLE